MPIDSPVGPTTKPTRLSGAHPLQLIALVAAAALAFSALGCSRDLDSRLAEIRALQEGGEFEASIEPIRVLLYAEPAQPEANYRLGVALVQTGRKGLAIWPLQKASQSDDYGVQAGLMLAQLLLKTQDYEEAIRTADEVLLRDPNRVAALHVRGEANIGAARPEETLIDVARLLELRPSDYRAHVLQVAALIDLNRFDDAEAAYVDMKVQAETSGNADQSARACTLLAGFYAGQGEAEKAEQTYEGCLESYPAHPLLMQWATNFFHEVENHDREFELWRNAVEDIPEDFSKRASLADLNISHGNEEDAEQILRDAVDLFDTVAAWQALSAFYRTTGDLSKAREALENALYRAPGEPEPLKFALADLMVLEGDLERATELASGLKEPAYKNLINGSIRLAQGDARAALEIFEVGLRLWPNNAGARFLAGQAAEQLGQTQRAMAEYREAIRVDQTGTDASLHLAKIHFSLGEWVAAQQFAERHIRERPYSGAEAHIIAARSAGNQGNYEVGLQLLAQLRARDGDGPKPWVELSGLLRNSRGHEDAVKSMQGSELDLTDLANVIALRSIVYDLTELGRIDESLALIELAIAANEPHTELLNMKGLALIGLGRLAEGKTALEAAVGVDATKAGPALQALARIAAMDGDLEDALLLAKTAIQAVPVDPEAIYLAARFSTLLDRDDEAGQLLRDTIRAAPGHAKACNDLAWRLAESGGDLNEALELAERATRIAPGSDTYDTLGWVQLKRGSVNAAVRAFTLALEDEPDSQSTRYHLALAIAKQGHPDQAMVQLKQALEMGTFAEQAMAEIELARLEGR